MINLFFGQFFRGKIINSTSDIGKNGSHKNKGTTKILLSRLNNFVYTIIDQFHVCIGIRIEVIYLYVHEMVLVSGIRTMASNLSTKLFV